MSSSHFSCSYLPLIYHSTNQNIQPIHSLLIRIEWTTGNGISESSSHWPIYNTFPPGQAKKIKLWVWTKSTSVWCVDHCVASSVHSVKDVPSTQQIFSHCQLFLIQQPIPKNKTKPLILIEINGCIIFQRLSSVSIKMCNNIIRTEQVWHMTYISSSNVNF